MRTTRSQIQSEVFLYILGAIILSLIILFGYRAVRDLINTGNQVQITSLEADLSSKVREISTSIYTVRRLQVGIPSGYTEVCFVDSDAIGAGRTLPDAPPLVRTSVETKIRKNVFLVPPGSVSFDAGEIEVSRVTTPPTYFDCIPVSGGIIILRLEGLGNRTRISKWSE